MTKIKKNEVFMLFAVAVGLLMSVSSFAQSTQSHLCKDVFEKEYTQKKLRLGEIEESLNNPASAVVNSVRFEVADSEFRKADKGLLLSQSISFSNLEREEIVLLDPDLLRDLKVGRVWKLEDTNKERRSNGMSVLSKKEFDAIHPVAKDIQRISKFNKIDYLVGFINQKSKEQVTYDELNRFLASNKNTNYFCKDGVPFELNRNNIGHLVMDIKH